MRGMKKAKSIRILKKVTALLLAAILVAGDGGTVLAMGAGNETENASSHAIEVSS